MEILIFGTGKIYERYKDKIRKDINIIGFLDNDNHLIGKEKNGICVYSPNQIAMLKYDKIILMSVHCEEMRQQLLNLGINEEHIEDYLTAFDIVKYDDDLIYGKQIYEDCILVFSHSLKTTGAQNALFSLVKELKKKNEKIVLWSLEDGVQRNWYQDIGVLVVVSENMTSNNPLLMGYIKNAKKIIINTLWMYRIVLLCKDVEKKIYWWIHETSTLSSVACSSFEIIKKIKNCVILSTSELVEENLRELYGTFENIQRLCYGLEEYKLDKKDYEKIVTFACIGGISWIKGQDIFVNAILGLDEEIRTRARFLIIGSGEFDEKTKALLDGNIEFLGEIDNRKMKEVYQQLDVVVCCSRKDNVPIVVAESCMNGKLSIISDIVGTARMMTNNYDGIIFHNEDTDELTRKMDWVIKHFEDAKKIGEKSRKIYDENFSMGCFVSQIQNIGL